MATGDDMGHADLYSTGPIYLTVVFYCLFVVGLQ